MRAAREKSTSLAPLAPPHLDHVAFAGKERRAIGEQLRSDLEVVLAGLETTEIVRPFRGTRQLPRRWATSRREILKAAVSVESADAAADAATELKASFVKLVEDRLGISDLQSLIGDIDRVLELIESVARPEAS